MKAFTPALRRLIDHYASKLGAQPAAQLLDTGITKPEDVVVIRDFCLKMVDLADQEEKASAQLEGKDPLRYDAEKVYSVIEDWVEEQGFEFD